MKERKKPSQSWVTRSKYEIENADRLLAERIEKVKEIRANKLLCQDSETFMDGYEAGKREMIEKACEWLKEYTYQDCLGVSPIVRLKVGFSSVKELIEDFKKAMED